MIDIATIDGYLGQQGRFCLIDWLLADNFLHYADYECWRYGKLNSLDDAIQIDRETLQVLINDTDKHCCDLGLTPEPQAFYGWDGHHRVSLVASEDSEQNRRLSQCWLRPQDRPQLDLFLDNSAQIIENALMESLSGRRFDTAQTVLLTLTEINPQCSRLEAYQNMIDYGLRMLATPEIIDTALDTELQELQWKVLPMAQEVLGSAARDYLSFAWRRLADSMQGIQFNPQQPGRHISFALLKIPDYPILIECLSTDPALYRETILLERLVLGYNAMHQYESALIVWCLLMELDANFTVQALNRHQSHQIYAIWQDFWEVEDHWPTELFPAYILVRKPGLVHYLGNFPPLQLAASNTMVELLRTRLTAKDEISARRKLQEISPALLSVYLHQL